MTGLIITTYAHVSKRLDVADHSVRKLSVPILLGNFAPKLTETETLPILCCQLCGDRKQRQP